jgi:ribonuclease D
MNPVPGVFRKNRFKKMPAPARELFTKIFEMRDGYAEQLDLPPNTVLSNENVFALSQRQISPGRLRFPHRVSREIRDRICRELEDILGS